MFDVFGLQISTAEFLWTLVSFFLFMFLLNKFLFKPVLALMDERKARIDAGIAKGKTAEAALRENETKLAQELVSTGDEARQIINSARAEAEKEKDEVLAKAHAEAEDLHADVRQRVKASEEAAASAIDDSMPELVVLLSEKLLGSNTAQDQALIRECVEESKK